MDQDTGTRAAAEAVDHATQGFSRGSGGRRQPVQSNCYAWSRHPHAFVDDIDNPYTTEPDKPFMWIRGRQVGGRMIVRSHPCQFYRLSDLDFKAGDRDGARCQASDQPTAPIIISFMIRIIPTRRVI